MTSRLMGPTAAAIVKPRTKPRNANAGSTGSPFGDEKTPSASAAGASRAGSRRPSGRARSGRGSPDGLLLESRGAAGRVHHGAGWGKAWPLSTAQARPRPDAPAP